MKSLYLGKYWLFIREYSMIPDEERYKLPAGKHMEHSRLFSLLTGSGDSEHELAYLVYISDEEKPGSYEVLSLTNIAALYAYLIMVLSSKERQVKLHKSMFTAEVKAGLQTFWAIAEDIDYWYITLRSKPDTKVVVKYIEEFLKEPDEVGIIQLVVGSKVYDAPATIETIEWFSNSLIEQRKIGYVVMNSNLKNYGELIEFILGYEHACVEVDRSTGEIRVWVVLAGPFLISQKFPRENRRYMAWAR